MNNNNDKKMNWNKNNKHQNRITSKNNWIIWYWKMRRKRSKLRVVKISKQLKIRKLPLSRTVLKSPRKNLLWKIPTDKMLKKLLLKLLIKLFNKNLSPNNSSNKIQLPNKPLYKNNKNSNNQLKPNNNNSKPQERRYKRSSKYKKSKKYKFNHWSPNSLNTLTNKSTTFSPDMSVKFLPHCSIKRPVKWCNIFLLTKMCINWSLILSPVLLVSSCSKYSLMNLLNGLLKEQLCSHICLINWLKTTPFMY